MKKNGAFHDLMQLFHHKSEANPVTSTTEDLTNEKNAAQLLSAVKDSNVRYHGLTLYYTKMFIKQAKKEGYNFTDEEITNLELAASLNDIAPEADSKNKSFSQHAKDSAEVAREHNLSESVVEIIANHHETAANPEASKFAKMLSVIHTYAQKMENPSDIMEITENHNKAMNILSSDTKSTHKTKEYVATLSKAVVANGGPIAAFWDSLDVREAMAMCRKAGAAEKKQLEKLRNDKNQDNKRPGLPPRGLEGGLLLS